MKLYELCILQGTQISVAGIYSTLEQAEENESVLKKSFSLLEDNQRTTFIRVVCTDVPIVSLKYAVIRLVVNEGVKDAKIIDVNSIADTSITSYVKPLTSLKGKIFSRPNTYTNLQNEKCTFDNIVEVIVEIEKDDTKESLKQKAIDIYLTKEDKQ